MSPTPPHSPPTEAPPQAVDPGDRRRLRRINATLLVILLAFPLGGYALAGLDFAIATLIGSMVVALNFWVTQRILIRLVREGRLRGIHLAGFMAKLAGSVLVLWWAVVHYKADVYGLMLGLSSVLLTTLVSARDRKAAGNEQT